MSSQSYSNWYFILDWTTDQPRVKWSTSLLSIEEVGNIRTAGTVVWSSASRRVHLIYISPPGDQEPSTIYQSKRDPHASRPQSPPVNHDKEHLQLVACYKSQLQKAIRRQKKQIALETARVLMELDLDQLLRRLPIIMVEDTQLCPALGPLVWLMAAHTKGFRLSAPHLNYLLGTVTWMVEHPYFDQQACNGDVDSLAKKGIKHLITLPQHLPSNLSPLELNTLTSLLFRQSYGGLKGDSHMLTYCATVWANRRSGPCTTDCLPTGFILPEDYQQIPLPEPTKWLSCAIDFHCIPQMISLIAQRHQRYSPQIIKKVIWECQCKKNSRTTHYVNGQIYLIWETIRDTYYQVRRKQLNLIILMAHNYWTTTFSHVLPTT